MTITQVLTDNNNAMMTMSITKVDTNTVRLSLYLFDVVAGKEYTGTPLEIANAMVTEYPALASIIEV